MSALQLNKVGAAPWGDELLKDINLNLAPGQVLGIIGPNGAGKSSLLQVLSGQVAPSHGELLLNGTAFPHWDRLDKARAVGLLPQASSLNFPFAVEEVILLGRTPHRSGASDDQAVLEAVLVATDTVQLRHRLYTQLSGGERQRVQLARVLAQLWRSDDAATRLLLLDEPNNALDPAHQQMVLSNIQRMADEGAMVAMVMHDFNAVARAADQVLVMDQGRQVALGSPQEILTKQLFADIFNVDVLISQHPNGEYPLVVPA